MDTGASETRVRTIDVYGIRVAGIEAPDETPKGDHGWPVWTVRQAPGQVDFDFGVHFHAKGALVGLGRGTGIDIDRETQTVTYTMRERMTDEAMLHPALVPAVAVIALWQGRASLHCSALLIDGGVWGMVADREGGKSTTAALLVERGAELFADDMLILDGHTAFAGPGSIDLREEAAAELGGQPLGRVGERERWRKRVSVPVATAPLAGFVTLAWGPVVKVEELGAGDRIEQLSRHLSGAVVGEHLLALADRPMLRFTRPQDLRGADSAADILLDELRRRT